MKNNNNKNQPLFVSNIFIKGLIKNNNGIIIKKKKEKAKTNDKEYEDDNNIYKWIKKTIKFIVRIVFE